MQFKFGPVGREARLVEILSSSFECQQPAGIERKVGGEATHLLLNCFLPEVTHIHSFCIGESELHGPAKRGLETASNSIPWREEPDFQKIISWSCHTWQADLFASIRGFFGELEEEIIKLFLKLWVEGL